ncbi:ThiF family adenylyltransferase [Cryobacterium sp. 10S3]|uniref:ThiF family adenylyltransferase n=1 Tax=unclassified Cryobacterium TaxID=2649013 RepID=UPI002AC8FA1F|nr:MULTISPECIES: ThiF family adenylyltransferase [unclassified Cryobacterium]MEB0001683.1 ThiF family adenylyltransferase [Cryobacterium sp. RTC2.1]MEB0286715.1 ThiF family adenylyltransferase [Cryobacterium sp. 10S3]WPX13164.1 ThiF family adenylyltransferase [Cryobacterium sp. 10S3]
MSTAPLARNPDLSRLLDDGYEVVIDGGHLIVRRIPYVTADGTVQYGILAYPVAVAGDMITSQTDHRIWFGGSQPFHANGSPLQLATPESHPITDTLQAAFMLSSKPGSGAYPDEYSKVTSYVRILAHEALAIDPTVTATPGGSWDVVDDDSPFAYRDTATSRAGLAPLMKCFTGQRIAIVGLGGTGGYILDQIAKTPVSTITLVDGDPFENHNAFRAPGAASLETLRSQPKKVDYFKGIYSHMHTGIIAQDVFLDEANLDLLAGSTFVFLASDDASSKPAIIAWLERINIPFIDVGMGVGETDGRMSGLLRVVTSIPGGRDHVHDRNRIPDAPAHDDEYGRNIQIADLNTLNATMAVIRWKRHIGFYADGTREGFSTYSVFTNDITNEDQL